MIRDYILDTFGEAKDIYAAYNEAIVELADKDERIVLLYADYASGAAGDYFRKNFPNPEMIAFAT